MLKMDYLYRCTELEHNAKEIALLKKSRNGERPGADRPKERKRLLDAIMDIKGTACAERAHGDDADPLKVLMA